MFALFYYLQYLLLLYSTLTFFSISRQISYAQYQYTSNFDYRRRPSRLIINSIRRLRPFKAAGVVSETFQQQIKQPMNSPRSEHSRYQLQNALEKTFSRSVIKLSSPTTNEMSHTIPKAISPFLQISNSDELEEKPISVKPILRTTTATTTTTTITVTKTTTTTIPTTVAIIAVVTPTTTTTATFLTTQPILLGRISPIDADETRQARIQARWRKLGPLVGSVHYPYTRRNWQRIVVKSSESSHFAKRIQNLLKQRLRQQNSTRNSTEKVEKRPRIGGILLSNAKVKSELIANAVDEWPKETVNPTTTTTPTTTTSTGTSTTISVSTTVPFTETTREFATDDIFSTAITATTISSITANFSSPSSIMPSQLVTDFITNTTIESRPFLLNTPTNDYHFRKIPPAKKFKFVQKFGRQPRLKIRKQDQTGPLRGNQTASVRSPIVLPHLAPLNLENEIGQIKSDNDVNGLSTNSNGIFGISSAPSGFNESIGSVASVIPEGSIETGFGSDKFTVNGNSLTEFGNGRAPTVDFNQVNTGVFGSNNRIEPQERPSSESNLNRASTHSKMANINLPEKKVGSDSSAEATLPESSEQVSKSAPGNQQVELKNSGLLPALPPSEFGGEFGTGKGTAQFGNIFEAPEEEFENGQIKESIFTGESALTPNRMGPTGDGLGPPIPSGAAIPPPVPAVGIGGAAAGILPTVSDRIQKTENPPTTIKPSALLNFLSKADIGFNQAINHFEQGTPIESAAIDILEVALGSEKLDSQAKLLGHIDRTIGIDNLQRLQRWVNTGGALDALKEQLLKFAKNYSIPENLLPTVPPQLQYLFAPGRKR